MKNNLAPIVLFVYNRPLHTKLTLDALMRNVLADQSLLYIYADGPKSNATKEQLKNIADVRQLIKTKNWCKEVHIIESEKNTGLADSVIKGVTSIISKYGKLIVLEDDIITSRWFLKYMNDSLNFYSGEKKVKSISGYLEPLDYKGKLPFFLSKGSSWGWATWKRVWDEVEWDAKKLLNHFHTKERIRDLNFAGYPYYEMLQQQDDGKIDSWAIRFYASCCSKNGLHLTPPKSLTSNIGFDGSGTHCSDEKQSGITGILEEPVVINKISLKINQTIPGKIKILGGNSISISNKIKRLLQWRLVNIKNSLTSKA